VRVIPVPAWMLKLSICHKSEPISVKKSTEKTEASMLPNTKEAELWVRQVKKSVKNCCSPQSLHK